MRALVALLALFVVAGCGSSSGGAFDPAGNKGGVRPSGAALDGSEPAAAGEEVEVAPGLTLVYEEPLPADPVHSQIMKGVRAYLLAKYRGVATGGKDKSFREVTVDQGEPVLQEGIGDYVDRGVTVKGPVRIYQAKVKSVWKGKGAQVDFCIDERDAKIIKAKTGKATKPKGMIHLWRQTVGMRLVDDGWRVALFDYDPSANKECRR